MRRVYLILIILFSTVGCDQITKAVARDLISQSGPVSYLSSRVSFVHAENTGAFLSLGSKLPKRTRSFIFIGLTSLFLLLLAFHLFRSNLGVYGTIALSVVLAGGLGNLIDRIFKGSVTDFIILKNEYVSTGIFNLADVAIVLGVLMLLISNYDFSKKNQAPAQ